MDKFQKIDYRDLPEVKDEEEMKRSAKEKKGTFLSRIKMSWLEADTKARVKVVILAVIVVVLLIVFGYYFAVKIFWGKEALPEGAETPENVPPGTAPTAPDGLLIP